MNLSQRLQRLEHKNGLQEPDILYRTTVYEQRDGPNEFGMASAFVSWPNGKHASFSTEEDETFDAFKQRVEGEVHQ